MALEAEHLGHSQLSGRPSFRTGPAISVAGSLAASTLDISVEIFDPRDRSGGMGSGPHGGSDDH